MKPADIRSEVGTPGKAKPEMTAQAKDAQAKGEQLEKEMVTAHTSGQLPMEGRK